MRGNYVTSTSIRRHFGTKCQWKNDDERLFRLKIPASSGIRTHIAILAGQRPTVSTQHKPPPLCNSVKVCDKKWSKMVFITLQTYAKHVICLLCLQQCVSPRAGSMKFIAVSRHKISLNWNNRLTLIALHPLLLILSVSYNDRSLSFIAGPRSADGRASDSRARGLRFDTRSGHILSFLLPLIQEG